MLNFYFLDVQHGDSTVVEYFNQGKKYYGVIDSNVKANGVPAALKLLQELGAEDLSFITITHPHADHYKGMHQIMQHYKGRIDQLYTFPAGELVQHPKKLKAYAQKLRKLLDEHDDPELTRRNFELLQILMSANDNFGKRDAWFEVVSNMFLLPEGFEGASLKVLLPPPKAKGHRYIQQIEKESLGDLSSQDLNDLSIAFQFEYSGKKVVIGGDGTKENWSFHERIYQRYEGIDSDLVRLPHHGSHKDCNDDTLQMFFREDDLAP